METKDRIERIAKTIISLSLKERVKSAIQKGVIKQILKVDYYLLSKNLSEILNSPELKDRKDFFRVLDGFSKAPWLFTGGPSDAFSDKVGDAIKRFIKENYRIRP